MSGHIHAELMAQYAEDARETETPWERWEITTTDSPPWTPMREHPRWHTDNKYRRKPRTITINGREVPEPMRDAPEHGSNYFCPAITAGSLFMTDVWCDAPVDFRVLSRGLCHSTQEAAIAHAEALLSFTEVK